jgi:hypothetical protein
MFDWFDNSVGVWLGAVLAVIMMGSGGTFMYTSGPFLAVKLII